MIMKGGNTYIIEYIHTHTHTYIHTYTHTNTSARHKKDLPVYFCDDDKLHTQTTVWN